jgi:hypothetical protein
MQMNEEIRQLQAERDALLQSWKPKPVESEPPRYRSRDPDPLWGRLRGWLKVRVPWNGPRR